MARAHDLEFELDLPRAGWARVTIVSRGERTSLLASYTPSDTIRELLAVGSFLSGPFTGQRTVVVNSEPQQFDLVFTKEAADPSRARLELVAYPDHRRTLGSGRPVLLVMAVARHLGSAITSAVARVVATEGYRDVWGHEPPPPDDRGCERGG